MPKRNRPPFRDVGEPPRQSRDRYAAALAEVYGMLDEAELVAPSKAERDWVQDVRDVVREELLAAIETEDVSDDD